MAILVYHMVDDRWSLGVTRVAPRLFAKQVDTLLQHGFRFLTVSDYLAAPIDHAVALTFDDGYESVFHNALPLLIRKRIPATVFINPGYVGQWNTWDVNLAWRRFRLMDWRQIETAAQQGWEIGLHGLSHKDLSRLTETQLADEIGLAQRLLQSRLGRSSRVISYPFGNTHARVVSVCREYGIVAGLTMSRKPKSLPASFTLRRSGIYPFDSLRSLHRKAAGRGSLAIQRLMDICSDAGVWVKYHHWHLD